MPLLPLLIFTLLTAFAQAKIIPRWLAHHSRRLAPRAQTISLTDFDNAADADSTERVADTQAESSTTSPSHSSRTRSSSASSITSSSRSISSSDSDVPSFSASQSFLSSSSTRPASKLASTQGTSLLDKEVGGLPAKYFVIVMVGLALLFVLMAIAVTCRRRKSKKEARLARGREEEENGNKTLAEEARKRKRVKEIELGLKEADDNEEDDEMDGEVVKDDTQSFAPKGKATMGSPPQGIAYPAQNGAYLQTLGYQYPTASPSNQFRKPMPTFSPPSDNTPPPPRSVRFR